MTGLCMDMVAVGKHCVTQRRCDVRCRRHHQQRQVVIYHGPDVRALVRVHQVFCQIIKVIVGLEQ